MSKQIIVFEKREIILRVSHSTAVWETDAEDETVKMKFKQAEDYQYIGFDSFLYHLFTIHLLVQLFGALSNIL